ncbi:YfiR family protein [Hydrogenophaga sp.]|uniref:YfiR family protein n=1 Tax=Hydrogenophaga sp. TaxID=1904254 RepID=UPI003F71D116
MALATQPARAGDLLVEEQEALHLQRFIGYIEWPAGAFALPASAIVVGIAGAEQTLELLSRAVAGKVVQGRPVQVRPLQRPEQIDGAHLAYIGREAWDRLSEWVAASRTHDVVLATNAPDGVARGATLGLIQVDQRTRFEASVPAAAQVGVKLSARLLEVAERVVGHQP